MRGKSNMYHLIVHLLLLAGIVIVVFPFVWMVLTSFKTNWEALHIPGIYRDLRSSAICDRIYEHDHFHRYYNGRTGAVLFYGSICICKN